MKVSLSTSSLGILFIALKLTNYIDWSWWWVLCPLWATAAVAVSIFLAVLMTAVVTDFFSKP